MRLPDGIRDTADVLAVVEAAMGDAQLVAIVSGPAKMVMPIDGVLPNVPDAVITLDKVLRRAIGDRPGHLTFAVRRAPADEEVGSVFTVEEVAAWRAMHEAHAGLPLRLCDWLILLPGNEVLSFAALVGPAADYQEV